MVYKHKSGAQKRRINKDKWERAAKISKTLSSFIIKETEESSHESSSPSEEFITGMTPSTLSYYNIIS